MFLQPHAVVINSIIGWSSVIGSWARIEGLVNKKYTSNLFLFYYVIRLSFGG